MKRSYLVAAGFLAVLMLGAIVPAHAVDPDTLYVRYIEGAVGLSEAGSAQAMEAVVNTPLIGGDAVASGPNGKAELFLKDGSMVRAGNNSVLRVVAVNNKGVQFNLQQGCAFIVSRGSREVPIFLDTPLTALDISSPSTVRIDVYSNGINEISVLTGGIFASQPSGRMLIRQGERLVLKADGSLPVVAALRTPDDWLRWNAGRDAVAGPNAAASDSYAYLPEELRTYSPDLDANGQWIYTPEYDYVWVPTVIVAGTWSPYRYGRWGWIGGNYVWIGFEPWGWVPYHYGRWVHHGRAGWCWVPPRHRDVRWEPAHVAWINSARQIGWVPLAPGERYDRRTAPAFRQANAFNVPYNNVTIERSAAAARTNYRNAAVVNSMVTVERDRMFSQRTMNVTAGNKSAVTLRKVGLPANITPAHAPGRPVGAQIAPVSQASAPLQVSGAGSKDIAGGGTNSPPVTTRQFSGTSMNSRIENARNSGNRDAQPGPGKTNVPDVQRGPAPSYGPTVTPLRERIQTANSPAAKRDTKPASQPGGLGNTMNVRSTAVASQPPATPLLPRETNRAPVRPTLADPPQAGKTPSTHGLNAGGPGAPGNPTSSRAISVQPPAREPAQAVRVSTISPAPSANQAARPAFTEKRLSPPVVSAAPQPSSGSRPVATRQYVTRSEPVKNPAPQAVHQPQAVRQPPPAPLRTSPAPQAAAPSKAAAAPAQPVKNDRKAGPEKNNNRPHA